MKEMAKQAAKTGSFGIKIKKLEAMKSVARQYEARCLRAVAAVKVGKIMSVARVMS